MNGYGYMGGQGYATQQFDFDPVRLGQLGFNQNEIGTLQYILNNGGKPTVQFMTQCCGLAYEQAQRLKYMFDICAGRVVISTDEDFQRHLKRMFGKHRRLGLSDLPVSTISEIPRMALVAGIPADTPFAIWNSKQYPPLDRMYQVVDVSGSNIIIETTRIPRLLYRQERAGAQAASCR